MIQITVTLELVERIIHVIASFAVFIIAWAEVDSVYGITELKKANRRWRRKIIRKFLKTSSYYIRSKRHG